MHGQQNVKKSVDLYLNVYNAIKIFGPTEETLVFSIEIQEVEIL